MYVRTRMGDILFFIVNAFIITYLFKELSTQRNFHKYILTQNFNITEY